jgi:hypothetical protein
LPPGRSADEPQRRGRGSRRDSVDKDERSRSQRRGDPFGWADAVDPPARSSRGEGARRRAGDPGGGDDGWRSGGGGGRRGDDRSIRESGAWGQPPRRR